MALSLSNFLVTLLALLPFGLISGVTADKQTHYYDWSVEWVRRNPDGLADRPVISINGQWPLPLINITKGDRLVVNLHNNLGNQSTSMHWHGLYQNGTNEMDGPVGVTQCDIPPGHSMLYNFTIDQPGTYWYHSHTRGQYPDGWRGQFVVNDPENPYLGQYDEEVAFTLSDWYHDQIPYLLKEFISYKNPTGAEPIPNSALMNDTQNLTVSFQPGKTYFFRVSNVAAFAGQYFWIEGHNMTIIEVDGTYTKPAVAEMIYITAAQRYGFLVTAREDSSANFAMVGSMDESYFDVVPSTLNPNVTGYLMYNEAAPKKPATHVDSFTKSFDDYLLLPYDGLEIFEDVGQTITLNLAMKNLGNGANYAFFNDITYVTPIVPTLYSVLTTGDAASNASVYGKDTNAFVLDKGDVIEIILNSNDPGKHPFHLHGHQFQAVYRSPPYAGPYNPDNIPHFRQTPVRRDVFMVRPSGHFVIRFVADNPGVWYFHCHIDWHLITGLAAVMVEAPLDLQKTLKVPENHYDVCRAAGTPYRGNAAANTKDVYDLKGQNTSIPPLPSGFTARGIVALAFSCVAAILGMAVIAWYGWKPIGAAEQASARNFIARVEHTT